MLKKLYLIAIVLVFALPSFAQTGTGSLKGVIKDEKTGETIPFAAVVVKEGETQIAGTATDIDGKYTIKPLAPGKYDLYIQVVGYNTKVIAGLIINSDKITFQDVNMSGGINLEEIDVVEYVVPLIDKDGGASGGTVSNEDIAKMPLRSATSIATTVAGVTSDANGDLNVRGARSDNTYYYIDGVKVIGTTNLPKSSIQEVSVITGGVPANYGDVTGGVVNITTKGAASKLYGGVELLSSGFQSGENGAGLDRFGYNLAEGYLSGPLAFKKDSLGNRERSVLGFFVSGNYTSQLDNRPTFGLKKINDDARQQIIDNPLRLTDDGLSTQYNAEYLRDDSFHDVHTRQNDKQQQVNVSGKIDISPSEMIDISLGVQYNWQKDNAFNYGRSLMNSKFNQQLIDQNLRTYARFVQRFKNNPNGKGVKNAFYSILVDYSKNSGQQQDGELKDDYFSYGYLGKFETHSQPHYSFDANRQAFLHDGFEDTLVTFTASDINSEAAAVTSQYYDFFGDNANGNISSLGNIQQGLGLINGQSPRAPYNLWTHPGARSNFYRKYDNQQFRISANGSADIGEHALQLGIEFEQRIESRYAVGDHNGRGPRDLWLLSRQQANSHLTELDKSDSTVSFPNGTVAFITYPVLVDLNSQSTFDRNLRASLGLDPDGDEIIDVDALNPEQLNLSFFSPDELLNQGNNYVEYRGYDYAGNKTSGASNFNDFFTQTDENGNFTRSIGAYSPNYVAGYIMDKFALNDIIFNVGVRVDRFDANQGVLKDPFVVGETYKAGEVSSIGGESVSHPSGIGDNYVVYVDDVDDPSRIVGYRNDEQWFDAQGSPIEDPSTIAVGGAINPYLVFGSDDLKNVSTAFEDYNPQVNVMPRIAFSFPISDVALFFAHYDILTQRPTGNNILNPIDYLYLRTVTSLPNRNLDEPNLKSEKTTDYELGFQQVVSKTSSIKLSAFYRQMQDNIQLRTYVGAYPVNYNTYDNIDFGTVKGFSFTYDLRRTGNVRLNVSYTLQFADGTGSSSTTAQALINAGQPNLRTIYPLDFDTRHNVVATFDFRYGRGASYNGPMIGSSQILADFGINLIGRFNSGTPYSKSKSVSSLFENNNRLTGQINGSRLPSTFGVDLQIDQSFPIRLGTDADGNKKMGNLNIYLWIANLINTKNVISVYRYTGAPDDDGYLATTRGQQDANSQNDKQSFENYYNISMRSPFAFGHPRTIRLGLRFDF